MIQMKNLLIINPNSSIVVTKRISDSLTTITIPTDVNVECRRIIEGPSGIETQEHVEQVIPLLKNEILNSDFDAYILACFSDPGISKLREVTGKRIFGIGECAYLQAMSIVQKFGILSILPASCERQIAYLKILGFQHRLAATLPLHLGVSELEDEETTLNKMLEVSEKLINQGAELLILGCAGMTGCKNTLRSHFKIPVIEPCGAATQFAINSFLIS